MDGRKPDRLSRRVSTQIIAEVTLASPVSFFLQRFATKCAIARAAAEHVALGRLGAGAVVRPAIASAALHI